MSGKGCPGLSVIARGVSVGKNSRRNRVRSTSRSAGVETRPVAEPVALRRQLRQALSMQRCWRARSSSIRRAPASSRRSSCRARRGSRSRSRGSGAARAAASARPPRPASTRALNSTWLRCGIERIASGTASARRVGAGRHPRAGADHSGTSAERAATPKAASVPWSRRVERAHRAGHLRERQPVDPRGRPRARDRGGASARARPRAIGCSMLGGVRPSSTTSATRLPNHSPSP